VVAVPVQQGRVQQLWDVTLRSGDTLIARGTVRLQNVPLSRAK
jgi:acyl-coenzyme A thioesterase PaaI-like protein